MNETWDGNGIENWQAPDPIAVTPLGWVRVVARGLILIVVLLGGLLLLVLIRLLERPIFGQGRPVTPFITQAVCRTTLVVLGLPYAYIGMPLKGQGAVVVNHSSWLDILVLNAKKRIYFVSKAEVANWPVIGWLARATGTLFIRRDRRAASAQVQEFQQRLSHGHKLLFFPEGTSSDSRRVLPFKATLFAAFLTPELKADMQIQPVSVNYTAPQGQDARFYGWWGDMDLAPHLLQVLAAPRQGRVEVVYHDAIKAADFSNRKVLAAACENIVRGGLYVAAND